MGQVSYYPCRSGRRPRTYLHANPFAADDRCYRVFSLTMAVMRHNRFPLLLLAILLTGCATPYIQPPSFEPRTPVLHETSAIMADGYRLPLTRWDAQGESKAIILAVHGLNDYSNGFESTGAYLAQNGITVIAYDQRGFGESDGHGLWHGSKRMTEDLITMVAQLRSKHPDQPLYLLGESMGGAVVLAALNNETIRADGIILVAPAVWSRDSMPFYQRWALWLAVHTMPDRKLTGEGLNLHPSDNFEMLRALSKDPLVIKATRVDVLYGMSNLMDMAVGSASKLNGRVLVMYGKHDEIIPREPTCEWLESLPTDNGHLRQAVIYENGYHMLTRDLQAEVVLGDIVEWVMNDYEVFIRQEDAISVEEFCMK